MSVRLPPYSVYNLLYMANNKLTEEINNPNPSLGRVISHAKLLDSIALYVSQQPEPWLRDSFMEIVAGSDINHKSTDYPSPSDNNYSNTEENGRPENSNISIEKIRSPVKRREYCSDAKTNDSTRIPDLDSSTEASADSRPDANYWRRNQAIGQPIIASTPPSGYSRPADVLESKSCYFDVLKLQPINSVAITSSLLIA